MNPYRVFFRLGHYGIKVRMSLVFARSVELAMQEAERRFAGAIIVQAWALNQEAA